MTPVFSGLAFFQCKVSTFTFKERDFNIILVPTSPSFRLYSVFIRAGLASISHFPSPDLTQWVCRAGG